jgi:hypothetical protein
MARSSIGPRPKSPAASENPKCSYGSGRLWIVRWLRRREAVSPDVYVLVRDANREIIKTVAIKVATSERVPEVFIGFADSGAEPEVVFRPELIVGRPVAFESAARAVNDLNCARVLGSPEVLVRDADGEVGIAVAIEIRAWVTPCLR